MSTQPTPDHQLGIQLHTNLEIKNRTHRLKTYPSTFLGSEAVSYLCTSQKVDIATALKIGNRMIRENIFHHVCDDHLLENSKLFYRFYSDEKINKKSTTINKSTNKTTKGQKSTHKTTSIVHIDDLGTTQQQLVKFRLDMSQKIANLQHQLTQSDFVIKQQELVTEHQTIEYKHSLITLLRIIVCLSCIVALQCIVTQPLSGWFGGNTGWFGGNIVLLLGVGYGMKILINGISSVARRHNIPSIKELFLKDHTLKEEMKKSETNTKNVTAKKINQSKKSKRSKQQQQQQQPLHQIHPTFPTIKIREILSNTIIYPNSRAPIPFQTETFQGHILFMLNTKPQDPKFSTHFGSRKRTMEVHIQGKFLSSPNDTNENINNTNSSSSSSPSPSSSSTLFIGGEIAGTMKGLGTFSRGIASLMLKMIKLVAYGVFDSSFGTEDILPHIVSSLYQGVDRFVVTPDGEIPPTLGIDLPETDIERKKRGTSTSNFIFNTSSIYSFSYQTMFIDFLEWQVIRIPGFKSISLEGYWGRQSLHIPVYSLTTGGNNNGNGNGSHDSSGSHGSHGSNGGHCKTNKKYHFNFEISRVWDIKNSNPESWPEDNDYEDEDEEMVVS